MTFRWKVQSVKKQVVIICQTKIDDGLIGDLCVVTDSVYVARNILLMYQKVRIVFHHVFLNTQAKIIPVFLNYQYLRRSTSKILIIIKTFSRENP